MCTRQASLRASTALLCNYFLQYISLTVIVILCSSIIVCTPLELLIIYVGSSSLHRLYYRRYNILAHLHVHIIKLQFWHCNMRTQQYMHKSHIQFNDILYFRVRAVGCSELTWVNINMWSHFNNINTLIKVRLNFHSS